MDDHPHVQIVMGVKNALPADETLLDIMLTEIRRQLPHATWTAAGIAANQALVMDWALARNAPAIRTGLEDNIRLTKTQLATSNAQLVQHAADRIARHGRRPATVTEARAALGLAA